MAIRLIQFADKQDVLSFDTYVEKAQENNGTVTGLYAGLMTSAMRDAKILDASELIKTLKEMIKRYKNLENLYAARTGFIYDCPNGTIERAEILISKLKGE